LGAKIRSLREARGISQEKVASEAGLERAYYGRVERGEVNISVVKLLGIAKALQVDIAELFPGKQGAESEKKPDPKTRR
jgi:transcriptional regulator with XRE-family HTH domain